MMRWWQMVRMGRKRFIGSAFIGSVVLLGLGCGAGDTGSGPRGGTPPLTAAGAGGNRPTGAGAAAQSSGGKNGFGNPTGVPTGLPMGGSHGSAKCLQPTIEFVVDGSGSMCEPFGASTRWQELRKAL